MFMLQLNRKPIMSQAFINGWQWMNEQWEVSSLGSRRVIAQFWFAGQEIEY